MKKVLRFCVVASAILLLGVATAICAHAQIFTTLVTFDSSNGSDPYDGSVIQATDGNLYGTTYGGGANGYGTVFKITPEGSLTTLYTFCAQANCTDGANPAAGVIQATDGDFYGTTLAGGGGVNSSFCFGVSCGTVFKITSGGELTTLYAFCLQSGCPDGATPLAGLVQAADGDLYGTTISGGLPYEAGTIFKISRSGILTTLHSFDNTDGSLPIAGLVQARNGNLYGTTSGGGPNNPSCPGGCGTAFKIAPSGILTTLYSFCAQASCTDGIYPYAGELVQARDGDLYGTTERGGVNNDGTVFKITLGGTLTTLYSFCVRSNCTDGLYPQAGLVQGTDGNFYGTTYIGGAKNYGTVFKISSGGALTTVHSFSGGDGAFPDAQLTLGTDGSFYSTTSGGIGNDGTVFSLNVGLAPLVETLPTIGHVGSKVTILGNHLNGTTSLTFNGTAATFTVVSPAEIETTVPVGATSGNVQVTTPSGTLTSNVVFQVK